jgi:iron complex transport system substrate-binding protein
MAAHLLPAPARPRGRLSGLVAALLPLLLIVGCTTGTGVGAPSPIASLAATPASSAGGPSSSPTAAVFPVTLTDDEGTVVTIPAEPRHIVSLTPAATEILFAIGAGPRVVAKVDDPTNYPPEASSLPVVATYQGVEVEKIVAAQGDLVVSGGANFGQGAAVEQLRRANVPVLVIDPKSTGDVLANIRLIGKAVGAIDAANGIADMMGAQFTAIRSATMALGHPKTFYEIDASSSIYTAATGSFLEEMLLIAGATPVSEPGGLISVEQLIDANPDVILLGDAAYGASVDQVKARPSWSLIQAVKTGAIDPVNDIVITRPGPRLVLGLLELVRAIHPDLVLPSSLPSPEPVPVASGTP